MRHVLCDYCAEPESIDFMRIIDDQNVCNKCFNKHISKQTGLIKLIIVKTEDLDVYLCPHCQSNNVHHKRTIDIEDGVDVDVWECLVCGKECKE